MAARTHGAGFKPQTDLLVAVENAAGDKVVLSWGEIYYPAALHRVIIAAAAAPIIPSETKENWPLAAGVKLVCANDLLSERGILNPTRITVFTAPLEIPDKKGLKPLTVAEFPGPPARQARPSPSTRPHWPRKSGSFPRFSTAAARASTASSSSPAPCSRMR